MKYTEDQISAEAKYTPLVEGKTPRQAIIERLDRIGDKPPVPKHIADQIMFHACDRIQKEINSMGERK